jgi:class 3 adenylate cyclase
VTLAEDRFSSASRWAAFFQNRILLVELERRGNGRRQGGRCGDAPNIAARVQEAAAPGTVLVTDATHRLISGLFVVEARGAKALRGIQRPVQFYLVIQPGRD